MSTEANSAYPSQPNHGALFFLNDPSKVFGRINIFGEDRRIAADSSVEPEGTFIRGHLKGDDGMIQLELKAAVPNGKLPHWTGTLTSTADPAFRRRIVGWNNVAKSSGREYIRLVAKG